MGSDLPYDVKTRSLEVFCIQDGVCYLGQKVLTFMLYNMGEVRYNHIGMYTFETKREKKRFTVVCPRCRQNLKTGHFTLLF